MLEAAEDVMRNIFECCSESVFHEVIAAARISWIRSQRTLTSGQDIMLFPR
jgi:hypothetical protein